jgi:Flp pilus assembly protein TadG
MVETAEESGREQSVSVARNIRNPQRRARQERGAALVELSISIVLLLTLLFGIISYGYALSFKQGLTQAAAEGARAAAVATAGQAATAAAAAVVPALGAFNKSCASTGMTCTYSVLATDTGCTAGTSCMRVQVSYDYNHYPLIPKFPGLGLLLPDTIKSTSITQVN